MSENAINQESMLRVGTILHGSYRIDRYLSSGGFGNTYVATHIDFDETYAVKEFFMKGVTQRDGNNTTVSVSNREKVDEFKGQLEKFKKEARRLRRLNNPHIVRVHDLFEENGTAYYVMDYVDGENLKERMVRTKQPLTESEVNAIIPQVLDALNEVHANNIWHLDLKPANIMIDSHGSVKLIDFGASKQFNAQKGGATTSTAISYTKGYAPREQMEQSYEKFGPWTDFYALGGTLYNLLTNMRPPMPTDIDDDHSEDKHLALPLPPNISEKTKALILWLMKTNRNERPASVQQIREFLEKGPESEPVPVPVPEPEPTVEGNDVTVVEEHPEPEPSPEEPLPEEPDTEPDGGGNIKTMIVSAVIVLALILGGYYLWNNSSKETPVDIPEAVDSIPDEITGQEVVCKEITIPQGKCIYTGEINEKGVPNGQGKAQFADGRYYEGPFVDGAMQGDNAYFRYENGDVFEGTFLLNQFCQGKYTIVATGEYFEGTYQNGKPLHGKWYDKQGKLLDSI